LSRPPQNIEINAVVLSDRLTGHYAAQRVGRTIECEGVAASGQTCAINDDAGMAARSRSPARHDRLAGLVGPRIPRRYNQFHGMELPIDTTTVEDLTIISKSRRAPPSRGRVKPFLDANSYAVAGIYLQKQGESGMNTLYATIGSGNCFKPFLLMNQLGIPFKVTLVDVLKGETRMPAYLAINPNGTVPYLMLADGRGIGESNAMLWHLAEGSPLIPADPYKRAKVLQWMFFEQSALEPFISPARFFISIVPERRAERAQDIAVWQQRGRKGLKLLDDHLRGRKFLVDDRYTIADISLFGYTHLAEEGGFDFAEYPAIAAWIGEVGKTDGYVALSRLVDAATSPFEVGARAA